jgi:hypothetical protein
MFLHLKQPSHLSFLPSFPLENPSKQAKHTYMHTHSLTLPLLRLNRQALLTGDFEMLGVWTKGWGRVVHSSQYA